MLEAKSLVWLLRLFGGVTCLAVFAALLPTGWMSATHAWLGLGEMPRGPVVEYLTRSISLLYAIHGGVIVLASTDVRRFAPLITYVAIVDGLMGVALIAVDLYAGLPWYWIALEGPSVTITAAILLWLNFRVQASRGADRVCGTAGFRYPRV
jgi:hypothetical protein